MYRIRDKKRWFAANFCSPTIKCADNSFFGLGFGLGIVGMLIMTLTVTALLMAFAPQHAHAAVLGFGGVVRESLKLRQQADAARNRAKEIRAKAAGLAATHGSVITAEQGAEFDALIAEAKTLTTNSERYDILAKDFEKEEAIAAGVENLDSAARANLATSGVEVNDPVGFRSLGENMVAILRASRDPASSDANKVRESARINPKTGKLMAAATGANEAIPAEGGYLLQPTYSQELMSGAYALGDILPYVKKIPLGPNSNSLKLNLIDETSRATGSRYGGIQMYWLAEAGTKTGSKPAYRQLELILKKLAAVSYATDELLQDTTAHEVLIRDAFAEEANFMIEDSFVRGNGVGKPLGILNSGGVVTQNKDTNQTADTVTYQNILNMWARVHPRARANARWFYNLEVEPYLNSLALAVGTAALEPRFITFGPDGALRIMGKPAVASEYASAIGDLGDIFVVDWSQYLMIEKPLESAVSIHVAFLNDETVFRFVVRVDGQLKNAVPITPYKGTNTISPAVMLQAR